MATKKSRAHLEDYKKNADGSYTYTGVSYRLKKEQAKRLLLIKVRLWSVCAGMLLSLLIPGFLNIPGLDRRAYVLLPYAAGLLFGLSSGWALLGFSSGGYPLKKYVYQKTIAKLPARASVTAAGCALAVCGELMFLIRTGAGEKTALCLLFLALETIALLCALLLAKYAKALLADLISTP